MKRLFICEKPSLAEAVAGFLGNPNKKDGYFQAGNDYVVWLQGHILAQKMPEDYDPDLKSILMLLCQSFQSIGRNSLSQMAIIQNI